MVVRAAEPPVTVVPDAVPRASVLAELVRFSRRNTLAAIGGVVGLFIIFVALAAPLLAPYDPLKADFRHMNKPPNAQHVLGTDQVGRDTLSRVIYGARTSLFVAFSAVILGTTVGSLWGVASGYLRGRFDLVSQRFMEIMQSFPDLILAMAISMAIGTGLQAVIFAIAITRIPFGGRVIRSVALSVREMPYVEAGRASGASALRVMTFHVLPQCIAPYLVLATTHLGVAMLPGRRRAAAHPDLGQHAGRFDHRAGAAVVARVLPGPGHHRDRARVQPAG
jgi:peptide/nickel transport system permease protein